MQVTHKISRTKAGMLGGTAFSVNVRVELSTEEKAILDEFGAKTGFMVDQERFGDVKGANHGLMNIQALTSGAEFKLPNIQQANDFLVQVLEGVKEVKQQIDATKEAADALDKEFKEDL